MKKYIPVDFDEKGKVILGRERNTPTSNKFIPTTWVPGGGDEGKNGLKSISISPAITTTPALDSLFPIYWDDLTEEEKQSGKTIAVEATYDEHEDYYLTVTPTETWYAVNPNTSEFGDVGEPVTYLLITGEDGTDCFAAPSTSMPPEQFVGIKLVVTQGGGQ